MRRLLPAFVQRRLLLSAARRALQDGRPEAALAILRDGLLANDPRAESLRTLVLPLVPTPPPPPKFEPPVAPAPSARGGELRELLAQMRAGKAEQQTGAAASASTSQASPAETPALNAARARPARLRMSLDDAGSFLICAGESAVVGHSRAGEADVPILADLLPLHARFVLEPASFHGGASWRVEPIGAARAWIGEAPLAAGGRRLQSRERIRLGDRTSLSFEQPDSASISATLDLEAGLEAAGAKRILLFAPGVEGRLSIGSRGSRHVQAMLAGVELELVHDGSRLLIQCASGLVPDEAQGSPPRTEIAIDLRLQRPVHLRLCMPSASERPRWISFAPAEDQ